MVMDRRVVFWFGFAFLSSICAGLSYKYFDKVAAIVQLSITAHREQVLESAVTVASELNWDIAEYQRSVEFVGDDDLQSFVELEGGGKKAFVDMFQSGAYQPYQWIVRFFKEKEVVEMDVMFTPEGKRIGFVKKLPEQAEGENISKEQAQEIAEKNIATWCSCFKNYRLIEYDEVKQDSGRVDHSFVYERGDLTIGKGLYRFTAKIAGSELVKLEPFVKIPDSFVRRYKEMRSANSLIASINIFLLKLLYLFIFGLLGLFCFYRRNYLLKIPALKVSLFVAGLEFLSGFNNYPLWWNSYNTIQSSSNFIMMQGLFLFLGFLILFSSTFFTLLVAESAGRFMYHNHAQFFKLLSWSALSSSQIFKQVVIGYLWTPFEFGYVILFIYITETYCGWWSPSSSLSDPNVIASIFPWFGPISLSLRAGFTEEVMFRALPIAMTAFLTRNSKNKRWWLVGILILQALIFGGCHAHYANQPSYARLIELIIPSLNFAFLYYKFGLIPGVISHFVYDAILFALPVFVSNLFWSKIMVVFLIGLPFWVVLFVYLYNQKLYSLPATYFNRAFVAKEYVPLHIKPRRIGHAIPARNQLIIIALGIIGCGLWIATTHFCADTNPLLVTKSQAISMAAAAVKQEFGIDLLPDWQPIATVQEFSDGPKSRFMWQIYGKSAYQRLQGSYTHGVSWLVRFVQFSRPVQDRGEEYQVSIASPGRIDAALPADVSPFVVEIEHRIPESYQGADIDEEQALKIAFELIKKKFNLQQDQFELISKSSEKLESRRDWTIVVQDFTAFDFEKSGQARIEIKISGDVVTMYVRYIHAPEDWTRADQASRMNVGMFKIGLYFLMALFILFGFAFGIAKLLISKYGSVMMVHKGLFVGALVLIVTINNFCIQLGWFNTTEPFYDQLGRMILQLVMQNTLQIFFCSLFLAVAAVGFIKGRHFNLFKSMLLSIAAGLTIVGVTAGISHYETILQPQSGNAVVLGSWSPLNAYCGLNLKLFCFLLSVIVSMFLVLKALQKYVPLQIWMQPLSVILFCISLESLGSCESISFMLIKGLIVGLVVYAIYWLLLQYDMTLLPLIFAVIIASSNVAELVYPSYVGAQMHALSAIILMMTLSLFFYERAHVE